MLRRPANAVVLLVVFCALNATAATKTWTGAVSNLWSNGGNWNEGVPPVDGDALLFPQTSLNPNTVNDLTGLDLDSILYRRTASASSASGNAITLSSGLGAECCGSPITWSIPITLTASQTFGGRNMEFAAPIHLAGHTLTFVADANRLSGSIDGAGAVFVIAGGGEFLDLSGTATVNGPFTVRGGTFNLRGSSVSASHMTVESTDGILSGYGTLPATTSWGFVRPGEAACCGVRYQTGVIATGPLALKGGILEIDLKGTTPGTSFDQLSVTGTVTLGMPVLLLTPLFPAPLGQTFVIIANDGSDPVTGTFAGYPEGTTINLGSSRFRITYAGGDGNDVMLTVVARTFTTLTSSKNPTVSGEPFTLTAKVNGAQGGPSSGTVRFRSGATILATVPLGPDGTARTTVQLAAGSYAIFAEYQGSEKFDPSGSFSPNQVVTRGRTNVAVTPASSTIMPGAPLTVTIEVAAAAPATGTPTGTVSVTVAGTSRTATIEADGRAVITFPSLPPGSHNGVVTYSGDANFEPGTGAFNVQVLPVITISDADARSSATNTTVAIPVTLSAPTNQTVRVDYTTANGTATAGSDYVAATGTLEFAPGTTTQTIVISILAEPAPERPETFRVVLSNPQNAAIADAESVVTITNITAIPTLGEFALLLTAVTLALAGTVVLKR